MNLIIDISEEFVILVDIETKKVLAIVDRDFGLIRYITKITREYIFDTNRSGYIQVVNRQDGETLLHRIILEYYSQFDIKLFTVINNENYEVNHKNKKVWDNRLNNLEMVTHLGNMLHKEGKDYSAEIVITTEELLKIRNKRNHTKQYKLQKLHLEEINNRNNIILMEESNYTKLFESLYLKFNSITFYATKNTYTLTDTINREELEHKLFSSSTSNLFYKYIEKDLITKKDVPNITKYISKYINIFISNIVDNYRRYYLENIINNNIDLFNKYLNKSNLELYERFNICNFNYTKQNSDVEEYLKHNILQNFFTVLISSLPFTINKNNILVGVSIKDLFTTYKRYDTFRVLYDLGLFIKLKKPPKSNNYFFNSFVKTIHTPSFICIPRWNDKTFTLVNQRVKEILKSDIKTYTHYIATANFGEERADNIYKNPVCNSNTAKSTITNQDINDIILSFQDQLQKDGFILLEEILEELEGINERRKLNGEEYNEIHPNCIRFISKVLQNVPETKDILKQLRFSIYIFRKRHYK